MESRTSGRPQSPLQKIAEPPSRARSKRLDGKQSSAAAFVSFATTVEWLQNLYAVWHQLFRCAAGWLPAVPRLAHKFLLGRTLYQDAVQITQLRRRLAEMQCRQPDRSETEILREFREKLSSAPSADAFLKLAAIELRQTLLAAIEQYRQQTDAVLDWPSHYVLQHAALDLEEAILSFANGPSSPVALDDRAADWVAAVREIAELALGLKKERTHPPLANRDQWPAPPFLESAREPGLALTPGKAVQKTAPPKSEPLAYERYEFMNHAFELMFAESLASIIYETPGMPWEFHANLARQTWDELRHSEAGYRRCEQLGLPRGKVPQINSNYAFRQNLDPLHRFCLMTLISEASGFPIKRERLKQYQASGNTEAERFMTFDLADENIHVHFGHVWVPILMKQSGEAFSLDELKERCKVFVQNSGYSFDEERFKKSPIFSA